LEPSQKIAGFACRIHAFVVHGMVDAQAQTGRIWQVRLAPVTRSQLRGRDPELRSGYPAPAVIPGLAGRHAGPGPRKTVFIPLWVVVA
jgi:hypothetical protein